MTKTQPCYSLESEGEIVASYSKKELKKAEKRLKSKITLKAQIKKVKHLTIGRMEDYISAYIKTHQTKADKIKEKALENKYFTVKTRNQVYLNKDYDFSQKFNEAVRGVELKMWDTYKEAEAYSLENRKKIMPKEKVEENIIHYLILKGRRTGIVSDPMILEYSVSNFEGAEYQEFESFQLAYDEFYRLNRKQDLHRKMYKNSKQVLIDSGINVFFYVDGSISLKKQRLSSGYVMEQDGEYVEEDTAAFFAVFFEEDELYISELKGAMMAVEKAKSLGINRFAIVYDYEGIFTSYKVRSENNGVDQKYYDWMKKETEGLEIEFLKAKAHAGVKGNERVDRLVKKANKRTNGLYKNEQKRLT